MANEENTSTQAPAELPMEEYAAAVLRGEKPVKVIKAAASEKVEEEVATDGQEDQAAASTESTKDAGTTTTASATEEDPEQQIEEAHPAKKGIQKRFSEMTAKQKELQAQADDAKAATEAANRRADEAIAEATRLRAEAEKAQATVPKVVDAAQDPAPVREEFDDPDEYTVALSAYATRQELRKSSQAAQEAAAERAAEANKTAEAARMAQVNASITELHTNFQKRVTEVKPEYPDYDEKVSNNTELFLRNEVFFSIEKATDSPHILYHIASNPELADSLNKMSAMDAAMRIGELQAELRVARKPKVTKAATPVKPVGNRASPQAKSPNEESMDEYAARVEKEMKAASAKRSRMLS